MSSEERKSLNKLLVSKTEPAPTVESQDINTSGVLQANVLNDGEEARAEGDNVKVLVYLSFNGCFQTCD
jgi:hypothetical protein